MKIGIDYISTVGLGGNSTYTKGLIEALAKIDKKNKYYLCYYVHDFLPGRTRNNIDSKNFKLTPVYFSRLGFNLPVQFIKSVNRISLKVFTKLNKVNLFHFTNPLNFIEGLGKSVVTLHDLSVLHHSQWAKSSSLEFFKKNIKNILTQASKIIAVSNFTKDDIIKFFNIERERITVIYEGAKDIFYPDLDKKYLKNKFNLENYILYVGQLQPRKNVIRLLIAYSKLDINLRNKYSLVLVGTPRDNNFANKIAKIIKEFKINNYVKQLDWVKDEDLPKLYSGAKLFIFPSLFEGFGLPVLEALSCGVPVITSNVSSLPEVVGRAGILVNPEKVDEIKLSMDKVLLDEKIYQNLKNNCLKQAAKFNWQKAAKETLAVYEEIYKGS